MSRRTEPQEPLRNGFTTFEDWSAAFADRMRGHYKRHGYELPEKIRHSRGFSSKGRRGRLKGETWAAVTSDDKAFEIFIQPDIDDPAILGGVIVHEHVR